MSNLTSWIEAENLRPCLDLLAGIGETALDESISTAFEKGLNTSDFNADSWFELPLGRLTVAIARGENHQIHTRIEAPHGFARAVEAVTRAGQTYTLEARS